MAQNLIITEAGLEALINAEQNGTAPVVLATVGLGTGKYKASASQTALQTPFKTLNTVSGGVAGDNVIHLTVTDSSHDQYECFEVGIFTDGGVLFGVVSSTTPIIEKAADAQTMLAIDFVLTGASPETITVGDVTLSVPPATTEIQGVVELATQEETITGTDATRAVTPAGLASLTATAERRGLAELATSAETIAGTDTIRAVTPAGLASLTGTTERKGLVELATDAEVTTGTDTERAVVPKQLKTVVDNHAGQKASASVLGHVKVGNGLQADANGVLSLVFDKIYPVGCVYISKNPTDPGTLFGVGVWTQIKDRMLIAAGDTYKAGAAGGSATTQLTTANLPSHNHALSMGSLAGHTHTRGTMNIVGQLQTPDDVTPSGAFYRISYIGTEDGGKGSQQLVGFQASRNWTGATSSAGGSTPSGAIGNTGSGTAFTTISPYVGYYMWERTA